MEADTVKAILAAVIAVGIIAACLVAGWRDIKRGCPWRDCSCNRRGLNEDRN